MSHQHILDAATLEHDEALIPHADWFERSETLQKLRKNKKFPTIWCAGCGIGIVMGALIRAIDHLGLKNDEVALVAGIGCSGAYARSTWTSTPSTPPMAALWPLPPA
jgi:hypothetical protein